MAFVAVAEIGGRVLGPLVRLGQQHSVAELLVDVRAQLAQEGVRLRQVLAIRAFALEQIRHRVEPQAVDAHPQPEIEHVEHRLADFRVVEVEIRLMAVKAVPEIRAGHRVPAPVRRLEILKDDPRFLVFFRRVAPHVPVAPVRTGRGTARALKPLVLVGRVVHHQLGDDLQLAAMGFVEQLAKVVQRAVLRIDVRVIGDVVAVVLQRRRKERQQPDRRDAQVLDVIEPLGQAAEVADAVAVAVAKRAHVQLVDDRVLVPQARSRRACDVRSPFELRFSRCHVNRRHVDRRVHGSNVLRIGDLPDARASIMPSNVLQVIFKIAFAPCAASDAKDVCRAASPDPAPRSCDFRATNTGRRSASRASGTDGSSGRSNCVERQLDPGGLPIIWVEIDDHQHDVRPIRRRPAVANDLARSRVSWNSSAPRMGNGRAARGGCGSRGR